MNEKVRKESPLASMLWKFMLFVGLLLGGTSQLYAQQSQVTGSIVDAEGEAMIGVSVKVKGASHGTISDMDGHFKLSVQQGQTLVFSYMGYITQDIKWKGQSTLKIVMHEDAKALDEVVVVGYGTAKKANLSGAAVNVDAAKIEQKQPVNVMDALQGEVPGVQITAVSGAPGAGSSIRIRGVSTFEAGGTEPLYVVDGVIVESIDHINANDIKSLDILKDASSTSIYGARAANGVIIITTKSGESGKPRIDVRYLNSYGVLSNTLPQLNRAEREIFANTIQSVAGKNPFAMFKSNNDSVNIQGTTSNNYQDVISQTAVRHDVNVSISGGSDKVRTMTSIGYLDDKGIILTSYAKRFTGRTKVDYEPYKFLKFTTNINVTYRKQNNISEGSVFYNAIRRPTESILYYPDGTLVPAYGSSPSGKRNPIQELLERTDETTTYEGQLSEIMELSFLKHFKFVGKATVSLSHADRKQYASPNVNKTKREEVEAGWDKGSDRTIWKKNYLIDGYLDYAQTFKQAHNVHVMIGGSIEDKMSRTTLMESEKYLNKNMLVPQASTLTGYSITGNGNSMVSMFGRVNYDYYGRYIVEGSVRRDGSSRFGSENRYGVFPAASAAWRFSDEFFMDWSRSVLTDGKIRASWGINGNDRVSDYDTYTLYAVDPDYSYNGVTGVIPKSSVGNAYLKWEETKQTNIGLDLTFFDGRLTFTGDYYVKKTTGLFNNDAIPTEIGFNSMRVNAGSVKNEGFEFNISATPVRIRNFSWYTSFNWSKNKNTILSIVGEPRDFETNWWIEPGMAAGNFYGYRHLGVYAYDADNAYDEGYKNRLIPVFKRDQYNNVVINKVGGPEVLGYTYADGTKYEGEIYQMKASGVVCKGGDVIWEDKDHSGNIDAGDKQILGNAQAKWYAGWNNTLKYKDFTLNFSFYMSHGGLIYNSLLRDLTSYGDNTSNPAPCGILQGWRYQGHITNWFTPGQNARTTENNRTLSSNYLEDASFIRLQNVRLSYQLPSVYAKKAYLQSAQIYIYGSNLLTWTNYRGYDPEITTGGVLNPGNDSQKYPKKREFGFGVNVSF
ncbi:MAG: TonB-dependent receptor [Bacteroides nordii]|uniref:SusC/RagA family TonB-linked outer membrane protein n=1 Tax=Bacteroides nordii TaxID=291645 RepID=UPI00203CA23D|nr:TonB-dependent receptor [Bacteroides nordii]MBD9110252.1 TonB-dependent receptor [Bacteroides nordii]GFZ41098.1 SusC/RagA family TonB-linked outer membrane protein [Bacteroides nordii]